MRLDYSINPRKISFILGGIAIVLAVLSLIGEYYLSNILLDEESVQAQVIDLFSVNLEDSIPTWYSTINLYHAAVLLGLITLAKYRQNDRFRRYWLGLAVIFLYMSIDEGAAIHEMFSDFMEVYVDATGLFTFAWVVVGAPIMLVVALIYLRFVLNLPPRTRNLFFLAGALYVGGALVVEAISASTYTEDLSFRYLAIATVEELCEMLGVVTLIYTLLSYLGEMQLEVALHPPETIPSPERQPVNLPNPLKWVGSSALTSTAFGFSLALILWILLVEALPFGWGGDIALIVVGVTSFATLSFIARGWRPTFSPEMVFIASLTMPLWFRLAVIVFDRFGLPAPAFALLLVIAAAVVSILLPALHIAGLMLGFAFGTVLVSLNLDYTLVYTLYAAVFFVVLASLSRQWAAVLAVVVVVWLLIFPRIEAQTRTMVLAELGDLPAGTMTLYTDQYLDVLQTPDNTRHLYANGAKLISSYNGTTELISNLLNDLLDSQNALLIGTGTMEMAEALNAGHLTILETDPLFARVRLLFTDNPAQTVIVDDPARFLSTTAGEYDLVVIETPSLLDINTVKLYSVPTYAALESRLASDGVVVTSLITPFKPDERISRQIAASLLQTFDEVMVIAPSTLEWGVAIAADDLPYDRQTLSDLLNDGGSAEFVLFDTPAVEAVVGDAEPVN